MIATRTHQKTLDLPTLFSWFIIYSYIGWLYETIYCSLQAGRFVNRGFLYGPVCPIYGFSILLMIILLSDRCKNTVTLFFSCAFIASVFEYAVSYGMELIFHRRWWNYSKLPLNLNGRVCVGAAAIFGVSGVLIVRYIHPSIVRYMKQNFTDAFIRKVDRAIMAIFLFDVIVSIRMSLT